MRGALLAHGEILPQRAGRIGAERVIRHLGDKDGESRSALRTCPRPFTGANLADLLTMKEWTVRTARLMVGVPDYQTYVAHRRQAHPDKPIMSYEEFFVDRQNARYAVGKGRFRGCC